LKTHLGLSSENLLKSIIIIFKKQYIKLTKNLAGVIKKVTRNKKFLYAQKSNIKLIRKKGEINDKKT